MKRFRLSFKAVVSNQGLRTAKTILTQPVRHLEYSEKEIVLLIPSYNNLIVFCDTLCVRNHC